MRKVREFYAEFTAMVVIATPLLVHEQRGACLARACLEVLVDSRGRPPEMLDSVFATFASRESRMPHETMGSGAVCGSNFSKAHRMHTQVLPAKTESVDQRHGWGRLETGCSASE